MALEDDIAKLIADAQAYAEHAAAEAESALRAALGGGISLTPPTPTVVTPAVFTPTEAPDEPSPAKLKDLKVDVPDVPDLDHTPSLHATKPGNPPNIDYSFDTPPKPPPFSEDAPNAPDLDLSIKIPKPPTMVEPSPPSLSDVVLPEAPEVSIPEAPVVGAKPPPGLPDVDVDCEVNVGMGESSYEMEVQVATDAPITNVFDKAYNAALPIMRQNLARQVEEFIERFAPGSTQRLLELEEFISEQINGACTSLPPNVEQQLFDRARGRARVAAVEAAGNTMREVAARGFTLPTGMMLAQMDKAFQEERDTVAKAATDIATMQAELILKNTQFAVTTAKELRTTVFSHALEYSRNLLSINQQASEYARNMSDVLLAAYESERAMYQQYLTYLQLLSGQYELQIKAALSQIDIYKAELEGVKTQVEVDQSRVALYEALIQGEQAKVQFYSAQVQAISEEVKAKSLAIDAYKSEVQAYGIKAQVKQTEVSVYEALLRGEQTRLQAELAKLEGYKAEINAYDSQVRAYATEVQAVVNKNRTVIEAYQAEIQAAIADADVQAKDGEVRLRQYTAALEAYKAQLEKSLADSKLDIEVQLANLKQAMENQRLATETYVKEAEMVIGHATSQSQVAVAAGRSYAALASSALNAQNSVLQLASEEIKSGS